MNKNKHKIILIDSVAKTVEDAYIDTTAETSCELLGCKRIEYFYDYLNSMVFADPNHRANNLSFFKFKDMHTPWIGGKAALIDGMFTDDGFSMIDCGFDCDYIREQVKFMTFDNKDDIDIVIPKPPKIKLFFI